MMKNRKLRWLFILFCLGTFAQLNAQENKQAPIVSVELGEIAVFEEYRFNNSKEEKKYHQLEEDLEVIYPLLVIVRQEYERVNRNLQLYQNNNSEKKFIKWYENYAKEMYMHRLSVLNARQGRLFIELISRELKITPYTLIKDYRNTFSAVIWQITANLYLANLKVDYDANKNPMIEHIMKKFESNYGDSNLHSSHKAIPKAYSENIGPGC